MPRRRQTRQPFRDRLCAVVAAPTSPEALRDLGRAERAAGTVELRLDWLRSDAERRKFLAALARRGKRRTTLIATCRRILGGGRLAGGAEAELFWLTQAREAGCQWCDLEVETLRELPGRSARSYPLPPKILLSFHDFERTPPLPRRLAHAKQGQADAYKIAVRANRLSDGLRLLRLARASRDLVAVPMGEVGLPARLLALRDGSALAYAPVGRATAPGQVGLEEFRRLYRADRISRATRVAGVIGNPIGHSLSPLLHNTGYLRAGVDAVFLPFLVENLAEFLRAVPEFGLRGISVTLPHKRAVMKYLDECDGMAETIGAVNTVVVGRNGKLSGSNTDYLGVLGALQGRIALGSSRALAKAGAEVLVAARREAPARELARACGGQFLPRRLLASARFELIVNATPVGMAPEAGVSPLSPREVNCQLVMDLVYRPMRTELLRMAAGKGIPTVSGVEMFLAQGFAQWELFTGRRAPEAAMRRAVVERLAAEESRRRGR